MEDANKLLELLGRLATDDEFRAEYEKYPSKVLAEYGVQIPENAEAALPSKEAILQTLNELAASTIIPGRETGLTAYWYPPWRLWIPWISGGPWIARQR